MADATLIAPSHDTTRLYVAQFLARYSAGTRDLYAVRMKLFLGWCADNRIDPIGGVTRPMLELYGRHLEEVRRNGPASVAGALGTLRMFYRLLAVDGVLAFSPAEHVRLPKVHHDELSYTWLSENEVERFLAASLRMTPTHGALAALLCYLGLRVSEACSVRVEDFQDYHRDHRVLRIIGKGKKPATMPLAPPVFRPLDRAAGGRATGPLLYRLDGVTSLDRHAAGRMTRAIGRAAGIPKNVHPHALRHTAITHSLDRGVDIRTVQDFARHSDPRITMRYDRTRYNLDRHASHTLATIYRLPAAG